MNNVDRAKFITVAQLIAWGADLSVVPENVRHDFAAYVMNSLNLPWGTLPRFNEIVDQLRAGNLIQAIKIHREVTQMGLRESKAAVEAIRDKLGVQR